MVKSLAQLRKERDALLNKDKARQLKASRERQDKLERQRLEKEIKLLKNPGKAKVYSGLNKFGSAVKKFAKERATIINENLAAMEREEQRKRSYSPKKVYKVTPSKKRR